MWIFGVDLNRLYLMHGYKKFYLMHHYYRKQYRTLYIYRTLAMDIVTWVGLMCVKLRQDY